MESLAEILGASATILSSVITITDKMILRKFKKHKSFSSDNCLKITKIKFIKKLRFNKMVKSSLIVNHAHNMFYLDENVLKEMIAKRKKRLKIVLPFVVVAIIIIIIIAKYL